MENAHFLIKVSLIERSILTFKPVHMKTLYNINIVCDHEYLVSFPDPAPLRGKEGLGTFVHFLGIFVRFKSCDTCLCACAFQQRARECELRIVSCLEGRGLDSH